MPDAPRTEHSWGSYADARDAVATSGAYFLVGGRFAFMIDPTPDGESLAVVRLGGRREAGETPWQCAEREVMEEAGLRISPRTPPRTYWLQQSDEANDQASLVERGWPGESADPMPILVSRGRPGLADRLSAMYLASAEGTPEPLNEAHGLLLLSPAEVWGILNRRVTLSQYLRSGGQAILRPGVPPDLPLEPHLQLRVLPLLLNRHPELGR